MTITSKSTDGQNHELSLTELDYVSGGSMAEKAVVAAIAVSLGPVAGGLFLASFFFTAAGIQAARL